MAWNRSSEKKVEVKGGGGQWNVHLKGLIAGAIVVLGAAVAAWWLWPTGESAGETPPPRTKQRIKEVTPAAAPKPEVEKEDVIIGSRGLPINTYGKKIHKDENGVWRFETGQRVPDPNRPSERIELKSMGTPKIFAFSCENEIAALLDVEPGEMIMDVEYGEDFVADFRESLKEEIRASGDDDVRVRGMKDAVIEVKKDLLARLNRGEDIARYMTEARNDLCNLHLYREELRHQVVDLLEDGESVADKDVKDLIDAANTMLRDKGVKELEDNEFVRQSLILERKEMERENAAIQKENANE